LQQVVSNSRIEQKNRIKVPDLYFIEFHEKRTMENLPRKFHGKFSMEFHVGKKHEWKCHINVFNGDSMGFHMKYTIEFLWKTFFMVVLHGQKHMKTLWRPVVFHGNSMAYSTQNCKESP